jgi:hypothetical protein
MKMNIRNGRIKVRPLSPPILMNKITDRPRAAKNDSATDAIRYSGAISLPGLMP